MSLSSPPYSPPSSPLSGKTILVTGASRGIGAAIAALLAELGATVLAVARTAPTAELPYRTLVADICSEKEVEAVFAALPTIDILVNNAGVGSFSAIEELTEDEWDRIMDTNAKGMFLVTRAAAGRMKAAGKGHILTIASDVAKRTFSHGAVYCASKYAQEGFMGALRQELRPHGIKVSMVYPGFVDTDFSGEAGAPEKSEWLQPADIAASVAHILAAPAHVVIDELMIHPMVQPYP